jgi:hypothetical protein
MMMKEQHRCLVKHHDDDDVDGVTTDNDEFETRHMLKIEAELVPGRSVLYQHSNVKKSKQDRSEWVEAVSSAPVGAVSLPDCFLHGREGHFQQSEP